MKPFQCDKCVKSFSLLKSMKYHINNHTKLKWDCDQYGETFPSTTYFKIHAVDDHSVHLIRSRWESFLMFNMWEMF